MCLINKATKVFGSLLKIYNGIRTSFFNLITHNVEDVLSELRGYFKYITAGGLIEKTAGHFFFFATDCGICQRRKLEKGENTRPVCHARVRRRCGINAPEHCKKIASTYHVWLQGWFLCLKGIGFICGPHSVVSSKAQLEEKHYRCSMVLRF